MPKNCIEINGRIIGPGHPPYIICELSANHNGSLDRALDLINAAAETGADAIKIQTYTPDTITIDHSGPDFRIEEGLWSGTTLYDLYKKAFTPYEWHAHLCERARSLGVTLFSTPFDESAVDLMSSLRMPAYKIASFEVIDLPLVRRVAEERKPMLISTGMASLAEIEDVVLTARNAGAREIILLHCVSCYPARYNEANLATIGDLATRFQTLSGLSDHTPGTACAVAAVALGACVVEKHFTLSRADGGADAAFSLEPGEFSQLVSDCRNAWESVGQATYKRSAEEEGNKKFRRSIYVVADVEPGQRITLENVRSIRPGFGLPPKYLPDVVGRKAARRLYRGDPLTWEDIIE